MAQPLSILSFLLFVPCVIHGFSILRGPFHPIPIKPVVSSAPQERAALFFIPKIRDQLSGRGNESFILFAKEPEDGAGREAKRALYRSFHRVSITYGWCLSPSDVAVLKSLREELFAELGYIKDPYQLAKIEVALQLAFHAHHGQMRKSGEPFVSHPVAVAKILAKHRMDPDSIAAGLLHDTVEDTYVSLTDIQDVFGPVVRRMVEGETKVSRLPRSARNPSHSRTNEQAENLCHLIFAMAEDWRVLVVKLADRLHNMRTLGAMPPHKQERTARETLEIFVPLAHKLGAWSLKTELEGLAFRVLYPTEHMALNYMTENQLSLLSSLQVTSPTGARMSAAESLTVGVPRLLKSNRQFHQLEDVQVSILRKPAYQIWKEDPSLRTIEKQEDMLVARVVLSSHNAKDVVGGQEDRALCFRALEALQAAFPVSGTEASRSMKDYIRFPRENGYMALHAPIRIKGYPSVIQVQVCMDWMDNVARYGMLAASDASSRSDEAMELPWLRAMGAAAETVLEERPSVTAPALMQSLKEHLTVRRLVFTPEGEILNLEAHEGVCTARDAALAQLKDGGGLDDDMRRLVGASVNGRHVPLSQVLRHGDVVGAITRPYGVRRPRGSASVPESLVQTKKLVRLWPWCLVGDDDAITADRTTLQAMWGSRVQPQRAARPGGLSVDAGELLWLREAELRHGRMGMVTVLYWWLSPLLTLSNFDGSMGEPSDAVAELLMWRGALQGGLTLPSFTPGLLQAAVVVGLVELGHSILMTQKLDESGTLQSTRTSISSSSGTSQPIGGRRSAGRSNGAATGTAGTVAVGVTAAESVATIMAALRQQELSWGRVGMLAVLSMLAQTAVVSVFGAGGTGPL